MQKNASQTLVGPIVKGIYSLDGFLTGSIRLPNGFIHTGSVGDPQTLPMIESPEDPATLHSGFVLIRLLGKTLSFDKPPKSLSEP